MLLLEHQAKKILRDFEIAVPKSFLIKQSNSAMPEFLPVVLKSQVPIGGRGKLGGIKLVSDSAAFKQQIQFIFKHKIKNFLPSTILAEEVLNIKKEFYLSLTIDNATAQILLVAHKKGGIEVEQNQTGFLKTNLNSQNLNLVGEQLAEFYELEEQTFILQDLLKKLLNCLKQNDATLLEINPLILTKNNQLIAADCKMIIDDNALFRQPNWEVEAKNIDNNFVLLNKNGNIATIANGAGLAMATVDAVNNSGLSAANFLDIGGGASSQKINQVFQKITNLPNIKAIIINIFAGITRCDEVAQAIITAKKQNPNLPVLFIRLAGTNYQAAKKMLENQNIALLPDLESCLAAARQEIYE